MGKHRTVIPSTPTHCSEVAMPEQNKQSTKTHREADEADTHSLDKETLKDLKPAGDTAKVRGAACNRSYDAVRPDR